MEHVGWDAAVRSDAELVAALRDGDVAAYEALWFRHVHSARAAASRIAPAHIDDLVSETFLAVFEQIALKAAGPRENFRGYLYATMRNIAHRWESARRRIVADPDADLVNAEDGWSALERSYDDEILVKAFRDLPDRWQRVLWLSEVETADRRQIAGEFGIGLNAVSALHRRARRGLRASWLRQQLPPVLRDDPLHVVSLLPDVVTGTRQTRGPVADHLAVCTACREVEHDLRRAYRAGRRVVSALGGIAALGVVFPAAVAVAAPAGTAAAAVGGAGLIAAVGAVLLVTVVVGSGAAAPQTPAVARTSAPDATPGSEPTAGPVPSIGVPMDPVASPVVDTSERRGTLGGPTLSSETIDIWYDAAAVGDFPTTARVASPLPTPSPGPTTAPTPVVETAAPAPRVAAAQPTPYFAPVLSGRTVSTERVTVEVGPHTYAADTASDGSWSFDVRTVPLKAGAHTAQVRTVIDGASSLAADVPFVVRGLGLTGLSEYTVVSAEASNEGTGFTLIGPAAGTVCVDSDSGQSARVTLDAEGRADRTIRFRAAGLYVLRLVACADGVFGATTVVTVSVDSSVFGPWTSDPDPAEDMGWEITESDPR